MIWYLDNCGYREDDSVPMARALITVVTAMMSRGINEMSHGGEVIRFTMDGLQWLIEDAKKFVAAARDTADGGSGALHVDFRRFRD